jgi:hypothetical protein
MRSPLRLFAAASAATAFASAPLAHADNDDGFEAMLRPAYGSAGGSSPVVYSPDPGASLAAGPGSIYGGSASPYGGGFAGDVWLGYRFSRFASVGVSGGYRGASTSPVDDGSTNLGRSAWSVGPYVRGYAPTIMGFEAWLSLGVEYVRDQQTFDRDVPAAPTNLMIPATVTLLHHGVAVPIGVGIDYRFLEVFGVGPSFFYTPVFAVAGCAGVSAQVAGFTSSNDCSDSSPPKITAANGYGVWSVGLDVRVTLF